MSEPISSRQVHRIFHLRKTVVEINVYGPRLTRMDRIALVWEAIMSLDLHLSDIVEFDNAFDRKMHGSRWNDVKEKK